MGVQAAAPIVPLIADEPKVPEIEAEGSGEDLPQVITVQPVAA